MAYVFPVILVVLGFVSLNLIRVGVKSGKIQSRLMNITRDGSAFAFWSAILFQALVAALCFVGAWLHLAQSGLI